MIEILSSMNFDSKNEKFSTSSIKTVDLANDTKIMTITKTEKK